MQNIGDMTGRTVLVTGSSSGIGQSIAARLVEAGATVHGLARRPTELDLADDVRGSYVSHAVDLTDTAAVESLIAELGEQGGIDTAVLAAGANIKDRRFNELTEESFDSVIKTNLYGAFTVLRCALPQLREAAGDVVLISSVSAAWPDHAGAAYAASKAGVQNLARGLSRDEHANGVRVCSILPGIVNTPILDKRPSPPPQEVKDAAVQPEDIAETVLTVLTLPKSINLAEITIVSTRLQFLGGTQDATPSLSGS